MAEEGSWHQERRRRRKKFRDLTFDRTQREEVTVSKKHISFLDLDETAIEEIPSNLRLGNLVIFHMGRIKTKKLWERVQVCMFCF